MFDPNDYEQKTNTMAAVSEGVDRQCGLDPQRACDAMRGAGGHENQKLCDWRGRYPGD